MKPPRESKNTSGLSTGIAVLFIIGVTAGILLEITGMILHFLSAGRFCVSFDASACVRAKNLYILAYDMVRAGKGHSIDILIMTLGIFVIILTPYIRVVMSIAYFAWERDYKYVLITLFVLIVLSLSMAFH